MAVRRCPLCGGDLVEWDAEPFVHNGYDVAMRMRGCPKVRDKGAGSPGGERWWLHYSEAVDVRKTARFP